MKLIKGLSTLSAAILLTACGGDDNNDSKAAVYAANSKLVAGESSVSYTGQVARQVLISELKKLIGSDELQNVANKAEALEKLNAIYEKGTTDTTGNLVSTDVYSGGLTATAVGISLKTENAALVQATYADISGDKNLLGKTAGVDNALTYAEFIGWNVAEVAVPGKDAATGERSKPYALIQQWFDEIADLAVDGDADTRYVTADGRDLQQLVQKFLLGAVTYSQAAEDYLNKNKGLRKQNSEADKEGKPYTSLEHQWDEGFGYFGAARDYNRYTDAENKAQQDHDSNGDGDIDLTSEYSFGHSVNAVKRDVGATVVTDFSRGAMDAFIEGRRIINANVGTNPEAGEGYHAEISEQAEIALNNWEKAVAATVVHYINDSVADLNNYGGTDFNVDDLAKHWSEMKGFALGLQFRPFALITEAQLVEIHDLMGEAPEFADQAEVDAYIVKLGEARDIMQDAYGFDAENVANW